jgi:glycosyltransferase involved in cell wall biosynthesis
MRPRVSIVIPAYNEGAEIIDCLDRILEAVKLHCEVLVVYDTPEDTTASFVTAYAHRDPRVRPLLNTSGRGPAAALRSGIQHASADVTVVTMADGSDDPMQIDQLTRLVERGVVVAAASRYMRGGQQVGGPRLKGLVSRVAGLSLQFIARVGTHDPTNSFKAYSTAFIREVGVDSDAGFELGIEMVAKAHQRGLPVAEIPTIWLDRSHGQSNFKVREWIPRYLHWYLAALGGHREPEQPAYRVSPHAWEDDGDAADQGS